MQEITIIDRWHHTVQSKSDSVAVTYWKGDIQSVTYQRMDELSEVLAAQLEHWNCEPETIIGVYALPSTPEWMISVLAVWKVGCAPLLFDASDNYFSSKHLIARIENVGCKHIIQCHSDNKIDDIRNLGLNMLSYNDHSEASNKVNPRTVSRESRAYIAYTSGSTGQPKAIDLTHAGIVPFTNSCLERFVDDHDVLLQYASLHFDPCWMELFLMCSGIPCVQWDRSKHLKNDDLIDYMNATKVTAVTWIPTVMESFTNIGRFSSLKKILTTGEKFSELTLKRWLDCNIEIYMGYGHTEETVGCTLSKFDGEIHLGNETEGMKIVLEPYETSHNVFRVSVEGPGVARGYILNNKSVVKVGSNEFSIEANKRVFKSGDLVSKDGDKYKFSGRIDDEIKIDGRRIEINEIEHEISKALNCNVTIVSKEIESRTKWLIGFLPQDAYASLKSNIKRLIEEKCPLITPLPARWYPLPEKVSHNSGKLIKKHLLQTFEKKTLKNKEENDDEDSFKQTIIRFIRENIYSAELYTDIELLDAKFKYDLSCHSQELKILIDKWPKFISRKFIQEDFTIGQLIDHLAYEHLFENAVETGNPQSNKIPLYCCPPVTGDPRQFHTFLNNPLSVEIRRITMPSALEHQGSNILAYKHYLQRKLYKNMPLLTEYVAEAILRIHNRNDIFLCGFSWGGQFAFAVASYLQKMGAKISWLGIIDAAYPGVLKHNLSKNNNIISELYKYIIQQIAIRSFQIPLINAYTPIDESLDAEMRIEQLFKSSIEEIRKLSKDTEVIRYLESALHHILAAFNYDPEPIQNHFPVTLFYTEGHDDTSCMCASINKWKFFLAQLQDVKIPELKHLELLSRDGLYRPFFTALSQYLSYSHEVAERLVRPIKGIKFDQANSSWSKRDVQGLNSIRSTYLEKIISRSFSEDDLNSGEIEADNISAQAVSKQTTPEVNSLPALTLTTIALFLSDSYNHKGKAKSIFNHVKLYTRDTLTTALNELDYLEAFNTKKINHTFIFDQNLTNVDYLLRLARILRNLDKYPDVVKLYPQVIPFYRKIISDETDPDTLQNLLAILCEMALMCGDLTIAEEACDKLLNIGKNVQEALEIQNLRFAVKVQCQKLDEAQKMLDLYGSHGLDPALIFLFYVYSRKFEEALKYITNINPLNIRTSHFCRPYRNSDLLFAILNFYQGNFHFCPVKILDSEIATTLDLCAKMHLNQLNNVNPENILNPQLRADIFYHSALANYNKGDTPTAKCQLEKAMTLYKESYNNDNFKPYEKSKSLLESWNNVLTLKLPH